MQISSSSAASSSMALQALRELMQTSSNGKTQEATGQTSPTSGSKRPPSGPPPGPPPSGMNGGGFSSDTMSSLLGAQEDETSLSSDIIDAADTNGDGTVSLSELAASLGTDEASVTEAFGKVDTDSDGQITEGELDAGLKAQHAERRGPPPPPSASDVALNVLASSDADQSGSLSLSEVASALGEDEGGLSDIFAALDQDGDGALGSEELTTAIKDVFAKQAAAYAANAVETETSTLSLAA